MISKDKSILVTGDVPVDHHVYSGSSSAPGTISTLGGAKLLADIIEKVCKDSRSVSEKSEEQTPLRVGLMAAPPSNLEDTQHHYRLWKPYASGGDSNQAWRVSEDLGVGAIGTVPRGRSQTKSKAVTHPTMLVISDTGGHFRNERNSELRRVLRGKELRWVLVDTCFPFAQGELWGSLVSAVSRKLIANVSVEDLRRHDVRISKGISWDRTVEELIYELRSNPALRELRKCSHLIITIGLEGALLVSSSGKNHNTSSHTLVFDPKSVEGEFLTGTHGFVPHSSFCMTSEVVRALLDSGASMLTDGLKNGLTAMRNLLCLGYGEVAKGGPVFPSAKIATSVFPKDSTFTCLRLNSSTQRGKSLTSRWSIIQETEGVRQGIHPRPLYGIARRVALLGQNALMNIPSAKFGRFLTIDRDEIESLRKISQLIRSYADDENAERPLSLAVFGPPGAGKSFGIKEISRSIFGDKVPILNFNLSQFIGPSDLIGAYHQVRDCALKGKLPIVFWDEFDSGEYRWLQYLLAPMQDGDFQEGQITHPIGKCVFVFAGATSYDRKNFGPPETDKVAYKQFTLLKGPDFVGRLDDFVNVLGPNQRQKFDTRNKEWRNDPKDICYPIRRALTLRSTLKMSDEVLRIDQGLLSALLEIPRYYYGVRSLEKLALRTRDVKGRELRRSNLPPNDTLSTCVDAVEFVQLLNRDLPFKSNADRLAPAIHEVWRSLRKESGREIPYDMDFDNLPDEIKEDNRAVALRMPHLLALVGLYIVPRKSQKSGDQEIRRILEYHIELLAEAEHNGWMDQKISNGWKYAKKSEDARRVHSALLPYNELGEDDREKDRNSVRHYPDMVELAGYRIVSEIDQREKSE